MRKLVGLVALVELVLLVGLGGNTLAQSSAQVDSTKKAQRFVFHGFVNPHYYADSRSVVGGREDMMLFYPKPVVLDSAGHDINDGWQANMLSITARLGLRINGPNVLGAKSSAYVEGDFTGSTNATINNLRLRHAYIDMEWQHFQSHGQGAGQRSDKLLMGQYWYPMVIHEIMPNTNPLNMGAPFHLYARYSQVRYDGNLPLGAGWRLEWVGAASWQLDNMSQGELNGVYTSSTAFARHSMVPEMTAQLRFRSQHLFVGGAANVRTIQPQVPQTTLDDRLHTSLNYSLFGMYSTEHFVVKAQTLLNNNLYEGCSMGGYLFVHNLTEDRYYCKDWHFNTYWTDMELKFKRWHPGIFLGYAHQNALTMTADNTVIHASGRGYDIDNLWRVQPRVTYYLNSEFFCTAEAEYTSATYLRNDIKEEPVGNLRLSFSVTYAF
ncbi:MAG: hypothetical protein K5864_05975 [Bacteroidales bacterium]|nr:hypothetical protein [Bacteroidales bacterium]